MLIKLVPEDFRVEELTEWQPAESGPFSVYELTKRKLDTFEAMRLVSAHARVPLQKIAYVGLKDRQGVTTQLISIEGGRLDGRISGIKYRFLGRARAPLGPEHLRGNAFTIVVRDHGIGVPEADRAHLFERYFQGEHQLGGMGLGLSLCYELVDRHGGALSAEFPPDGGTRMIASIPISGGVKGDAP